MYEGPLNTDFEIHLFKQNWNKLFFTCHEKQDLESTGINLFDNFLFTIYFMGKHRDKEHFKTAIKVSV